MKPDPVSLAGGVGIAALGGVLVLDRTGAVNLDWGWLAAALAAVAGLVLLVSGLADRGTTRHD